MAAQPFAIAPAPGRRRAAIGVGVLVADDRFWNTLMGAWAIFAGIVLQHASAGTQWKDIIVGALILLVSLVPSPPLPDRRGARASIQ